jgi:hypothetical protein
VHDSYALLWRWVFTLALLLELPLIALATKRTRPVLASLVGNALTHPALWFLFPRYFGYATALAVGETTAVLVEGASLATIGKLGWRRGMALSLAVNLYSWLVGELILRGIGPALVRFYYGH